MAKILLADDDALIGEVIQNSLETSRHEVFVVDNGVAALLATDQVKPDIIILDNRMPRLTGPEVLSKLKSKVATRNIPVIMLSSRTGRQYIYDAFRAGVFDYVTKPFAPNDLADYIDMVAGHLDRDSRNALPPTSPVIGPPQTLRSGRQQ